MSSIEEMTDLMTSPEFQEEVIGLSEDFTEIMNECQRVIQRYNQLLDTTQHILKEIDDLVDFQQNYQVSDLEGNWLPYHQKLTKGLELCQLMGSAVTKGSSINEMIGHFLLGAKKEAADIINNAQNQVPNLQKQNELEKKLETKQKLLDRYEERINQYETQITQLQNSDSDTEKIELRLLELEEYGMKIKRDADRYSRQRKLLADDQVIVSKREIDRYSEKRKKEQADVEMKLSRLTLTLQHKVDAQLEGALGEISEFADVEGIDLA